MTGCDWGGVFFYNGVYSWALDLQLLSSLSHLKKPWGWVGSLWLHNPLGEGQPQSAVLARAIGISCVKMSHRHLAPAALSPSLLLSCQLPCLPDDQTQLGPDGGGGRLLLSVGEVLTPNPILEIKTAERTNTVASGLHIHTGGLSSSLFCGHSVLLLLF